MNTTPYVIALYIRLSIEDSKVQSMSIENQKRILHRYVDSMSGIQNVEVLEFVDNGYSGTNFNRPKVKEMIELVQKGKINCVIVKDFSRFGRDFIDVGYYVEMVFPLCSVRFISVDNGFDSDEFRGTTGGLQVAFQFFKAEFYSRDLSMKYKSAKYMKFRRGEYQSQICPYGYRKSADGRMEVDEEAAPNVLLIFELARDGCGAKEITRKLFERGIPTPGEYKAAHGAAWHDVSRCGGIWSESSVAHILDDERYIGTYIIGKRETLDVGGSRVRMKDESQWVKIPDHHPAIITKELFEEVKARRVHRPCTRNNAHTYPLKGKVYCGCCHHAMPRTSSGSHKFGCRHSSVDKAAPCHGLKIAEAELERILYDMMVKWAQNASAPDETETVKSLEQSGLDANIAACKEQKRTLYEQLVLKEITVEEYMAQKTPLDCKLDYLQQTRSHIERQETQQQKAKDHSNLLQEILDTGRLTAELVDRLIARVYVYPGNQLEIVWKMKDYYMEEM